MWLTALTFLAALALPGRVAAQHHQDASYPYVLVDLGTFGGPASYFSNGFDGILNSQGTAVGWADTAVPDPYPAFCFNPDCFVSHAFQSHNGAVTDLGTLPGGSSSQAFWISGNGLITGNAQNGQIDPLIAGFPEVRAVLWQKGGITDLGTLEGGYESLTSAVNDRGQVVGFATNTVSDPFSYFGPTQARAFLWQQGVMQDLGTLGGPDANAVRVNAGGQIAGVSYTNATPNPSNGAGCAPNVPTQDPFLWDHGTMIDLGSLGGTCGTTAALNDRGEVVGQSNLAGNQSFHPYLWTPHGGLQDLGTLGGNTGETNWINDAGAIAGKADLPGALPQNHDAVLWQNGGRARIDLGTLPGDACSNAYYVNDRDQVVGTSEDQALCLIPTGEHAFLWQHGGPMIDLNTLIRPGSGLRLTFAFAINDHGEIAGVGVPTGCAPQDVDSCGHAYVLLPRDEAASEGIAANASAPGTTAPATGTRARPASCTLEPAWGVRLPQRYHRSCLGG
jgi:probable HAF family extracellular repeat protein